MGAAFMGYSLIFIQQHMGLVEIHAGFAVVTEEVRMLAQKTAAAAADISNLIQDNMHKAKLGSEISSHIAGEVRELDGWIEEVHSVSSGQLSDLQELKSITQDLQRSTQNTASNAEKNASTAEELQGQVHMLQQAIDDINRMVAEDSEMVHSSSFTQLEEEVDTEKDVRQSSNGNGNTYGKGYTNGNGSGLAHAVTKNGMAKASKIHYTQTN